MHTGPDPIFAGDFRLLRPLGRGGMGTVYLALQLSTGRKRALKILHPHRGDDPRIRDQFIAEARVAADLDSDHVADVIAAGFDSATGSFWLATEYLEGETLQARVRRSGRLPPAEVREILRQVCHAMGQAHAAGLVHRDLKPANLFVADPRRDDVAFTVKVLDFGIAKLMEGRGGDTSEPIGSPLWMAPEQCGPHRASPATDVWALGLVAYFCLVGRSFWKADPAHGMTGLLTEILTEPIPAASTRAQEQGAVLPHQFDDWFARTVVRDPAVRFRDASQALAALGQWSIDVTPPSSSTIAEGPGQVTWSGTPPPLAPDTRATQPPTAPALDTVPIPSESTSQTFGPVLSQSSAQSTSSSAGRWVGLFAGVIVVGGGALVLVGLGALYLFAGVSPMSLLQPAPGENPALERTQSPTHVAPSLPVAPSAAPQVSSSTPSSTAQVAPTTRTAPTAVGPSSAHPFAPAPGVTPAPKGTAEPGAQPTAAQVGGFRAIAQNCWANNEGLTADAQVVSITVGINGHGSVRTIRIDGAAPFPQFRSCVVSQGRVYSGFKQPPAGWSSTTFSVSLPRAS